MWKLWFQTAVMMSTCLIRCTRRSILNNRKQSGNLHACWKIFSTMSGRYSCPFWAVFVMWMMLPNGGKQKLSEKNSRGNESESEKRLSRSKWFQRKVFSRAKFADSSTFACPTSRVIETYCVIVKTLTAPLYNLLLPATANLHRSALIRAPDSSSCRLRPSTAPA